MGRLIDTSDLNNSIMRSKDRFGMLSVPICNVFEDMISDTSTVEAIPKADYETRLKADLAAMLTEIQLEIAESMGTISPNYDEAAQDISIVIQQKIDKLKGVEE